MSAVDRLMKMPTWPYRMTADVAAMFMGMSPGSFRTRYGHLGKAEGGNVYWSTRQLQELVDAQFGLAPPSRAYADASPPRDTSWDDLN
ncbi:MAG: hypothetical protein V4618_00670 [Pseudomonadota bacterium]